MSFAARSPLKTLTSTIPINDGGDHLDADIGNGDDDDYDGNGDTEDDNGNGDDHHTTINMSHTITSSGR